MLTIFAIPKPFRGHFGIIQRNAIQSWVLLRPKCEVILLGDEKGTAEIASELGTRHIPEVERNEYGTPLVSSVFNIAQDNANYEIMCYVNADIILMSDFIKAVQRVTKSRFLMVGQRWDVELAKLIDFRDPQWETWLHRYVTERGKLHAKSGIDYFVFPRGLYRDIPPFALGRTAWDNWLIYYARSLRVPVIDTTGVIMAIHQNHDYSHHLDGMAGIWKGPEAKNNLKLAGGIRYLFSLDDATHILTRDGLKPAFSFIHIWRRLYTLPLFCSSFLGPLRLLLDTLLKIFKTFNKAKKPFDSDNC